MNASGLTIEPGPHILRSMLHKQTLSRASEPSDDLLYKSIGLRIRQLRNSKRWTQSKLSHLSGVDRSSIANLERGRQRTSLNVLYRLCAALEIEVTAIIPPIEEVIAPGITPIKRRPIKSNLPQSLLPAIDMLRRGLVQEESEKEGKPSMITDNE